MIAPHRSNRSGVSLVEALVVITLLGVVLSGVTMGITTLQRVDRRITSKSTQGFGLTQLTTLLRTDASTSSSAVWDAPKANLTLSQGEQSIEYTFTDSRCVRTFGKNKTTLQLPKGTVVRCEGERMDSPAMLELTLQPSQAAPQPLVVALGRAGRLIEKGAAE